MTDKMIIAGAQALAALSPALSDPDDGLLPPFGGGCWIWARRLEPCHVMPFEPLIPPAPRPRSADSKAVNFEVALAVIDAAVDEGVSALDVPRAQRRKWAQEKAWAPEYREYVYDPEHGKDEC